MEGPVPFLAALGLIVVLEFGDKTQLATIALATRHPWNQVLAGAAAGLIVATVIGVALGAVLAASLRSWLPLVTIAGGISFIAVGIWTLARREEKPEGKYEGGRSVVAHAFLVNLVAEMGDKTQLATVVLTATSAAPVSVFLGASLGLTLVAAAGVLVGKAVSKVVSARRTKVVSAALFVVAGVLLVLDTLR